ncbi:universal stress protein [Amycolatopsis orientalis]|uniref:universal stress protein n=1 Tax=Amycolatopsis orientalis TaxID=31958 RepID=UPI0004151590|nr:universal stress protein [Amycolatopsis orientalis]
MTNRTPPTAGPIVVGVDGSTGSPAAVTWGLQAADRYGTSLTLVHALGLPDYYLGAVPPTDELLHKVRVRGETILREMTARLDDPAVDTRLADEPAASALIEASGGARLVVLGTTEHSRFTALFGGSVTTALAGHARCPVVSVRGKTWDLPGARKRPVVVGIDGSAAAETALVAAFTEASARDAELIAVHAWEDVSASRSFGDSAGNYGWSAFTESARRMVAEQVAKFAGAHPEVTVRQVVVQEEPRQELLRWSVKAQLIVVGNRGRGGFRGLLLGSTGQTLVHRAACPVLIARTGGS